MMPQNYKLTLDAWRQLMSKFGLPESLEMHQMLINAYSEKHRAYHTAEHIKACFMHLSAVESQTENPHEIELALWFHDAIYKPFSSTNEEDSAEFAKDLLAPNNIAPDIVRRVYDMIILTKDHIAPKTNDETYMIDIDLSILSAKAATYDQFERNVRKEYKWVPPFMFRKKRKEILTAFFSRPRIYHTDYFFERLEARAKVNLARAISAL